MFCNVPQSSFDKAELVQEKTRTFHHVLESSMFELEFSND